jgi:hypothetical protein
MRTELDDERRPSVRVRGPQAPLDRVEFGRAVRECRRKLNPHVPSHRAHETVTGVQALRTCIALRHDYPVTLLPGAQRPRETPRHPGERAELLNAIGRRHDANESVASRSTCSSRILSRPPRMREIAAVGFRTTSLQPNSTPPLSSEQAADSGRVKKRNPSDVDRQPSRSLLDRFFKRLVQRVGRRKVHFAMRGNRRFALGGGGRPLREFA